MSVRVTAVSYLYALKIDRKFMVLSKYLDVFLVRPANNDDSIARRNILLHIHTSVLLAIVLLLKMRAQDWSCSNLVLKKTPVHVSVAAS